MEALPDDYTEEELNCKEENCVSLFENETWHSLCQFRMQYRIKTNYSSGGKRTNSYLVILFCFIIQDDDVNGQQNRIVLINGGPGSGMMSTKYSTDSLVNLYGSIVIEKSCA